MKNFTDFLTENTRPGARALVALSGGADSCCLLHLMLEHRDLHGCEITAAHYNHRLRGAESDRDEAFVRELCEKLGVELTVGIAPDIPALADIRKQSVEECARDFRYDFLRLAAEELVGADYILTAHNADDNVETVLFNLTRGTGIRGLAGIPPRRKLSPPRSGAPARASILRPLLGVTRAEIVEYLTARGLDWAEDSSNASDKYTRNRLRHAVVPVLRELNPGLAGTIYDTAELLRSDAEYLDTLARGAAESALVSGGRAEINKLTSLPAPILTRSLRILLKDAGAGELTRAHIASLTGLLETGSASARLDLPGVTVRREYGILVIGVLAGAGSFAPAAVTPGSKTRLPELNLTIFCEKTIKNDEKTMSNESFHLKRDTICGNIIARPRESGDKIRLSGGTKSLKKLFIDAKIPVHRRGLIPVLSDGRGVIAVRGFGADRRCGCEPGDEILIISFECGE